MGISENLILHEEVKIKSNNQSNNLEFPSNELVEIYKMSDCFVLPSLIETLRERRERIEKEMEELLNSQTNINPPDSRSLC